MCEHCEAAKVTREAIEKPDDETFCEWPGEGDEEEDGDAEEDDDDGPPGEMCEEDAKYGVDDYYCFQHLCAAHKEEEAARLDQGLRDFLLATGFHDKNDFLPVATAAACEAFNIDAGEDKECGKPAAFAQMVLDRWLLCPKHTDEWCQMAKERGKPKG